MARPFLAFGCFCLNVLLLGSPAFAADVVSTWNGTGNWSDPARWNPVVPNNGAQTFDAIINSGTATLDVDVVIQALTFGGGTISGDFDLELNAPSTWTSGTMSGSGQTIIASGGTLAFDQSTKILRRTLVNDGTASWTNGLFRLNGGTIQNNGLFTATAGAGGLTSDTVGSGNVFNNAGTFIKQGLEYAVFYPNVGTTYTFNNSGLVDVQQGTLSLVGGGTHTGDFTGVAGALLEISGNHTFAATSDISGGLNVGFSGTTAITGSVTSSTTGTTTLYGTVGGSGNWNMGGILNWNGGGLMTGSGVTTIGSVGTLNLLSTTKRLERMLINDGTTLWTSGSLRLDGGTFQNNGVFTATAGAGGLTSDTGSSNNVFNNAGTFIKQGTGNALFYPNVGTTYTFNNSGTVDVQEGMLALHGGGTHTGNFTGSTGANLEMQGTHTFAPGADITGGMNVQFSGTTTLDSQLSITGTLNLLGLTTLNAGSLDAPVVNLYGHLNGSADWNIDGTVNWLSGGTMSGTGTTTVEASGTLNASGVMFLGRTLVNEGSTAWSGYGSLLRMTGGTFQNNGVFTATAVEVGLTSDTGTTGCVFNNAGTFIKQGTGNALFYPNSSHTYIFNNSGTVDVQQGVLSLTGSVTQHSGFQLTGGTWRVGPNATLEITTGSNITTNLANVTLDGPGSTLTKINTLTDNQGTFSILNGRNFTPVGAFSNTGRIVVSDGSTFTGGSIAQHVGSTLTGGTWHIGMLSNLDFASGANITTNQGNVTLEGIGSAFAKFDSLANNQGSLSIIGGRNFTTAGAFSNSGTVTVSNGSTFTAPSVTQLVGSELTAGAWYIGPNATLDIQSGSNITTNYGSVTLDGAGSTFAKIETLVDNRGSFSILGGRDFTPVASFTNSGTLIIGEGSTFNAANGYVHQATAKLKGTGTFLGTFQNSGTLAPGNSPGIITIDGDYIQTSSGTLEIEVGGLTEGTQHDQVIVTGEAQLAGRLIVPIVDVPGEPNYVPAIDDEIAFLKTTDGVSGKFDSLSAPNLKSVSNLAIRVFRTLDEKEVHLKFVMPTNVTFTDTNDANWDTNISWSTAAVPDTDNIVVVRNNAIGGDQRVEVQSANAFTDQLLVADPDAKITVGIHDGLSLSAVSNNVTIGNNGTIELGVGPGSAGGTLVGSTVAIEAGGTLAGNGTVVGDMVVGSGGVDATLSPGFSVGHVNLQGNYKQQTGGTLLIDVDGDSTGEFDTVNVSGALELGGTLRIDATNLTIPAPGTTFEILAAGSLAEGEIFDSVETIGNDDIFFAPIYTTGSGPGSGSEGGSGGSFTPRVAVGVYYNGDMNRNGLIDTPDVQAFALALTKPIYYFSSYYLFGSESGDLNHDGRLDFDDIEFFAALVQGTGATAGDIARAIERELNPVPEPSSLALMFTCAALLFVARRITM